MKLSIKSVEDIEAINRFFISLPTIDLDKDLKKVDEIYKRFQNIFGKNEDILGKLYEFYLNSENIRKNSGIYYTPKYIIEYIIKNTIGILFDKLISILIKEFNHNDFKNCDKTIEKIVNIKILDPACGSGTFLISAFNMIWNKYKKIEKLFEKINDNNNLMDAITLKTLNQKIFEYKRQLGLNNDQNLIYLIIMRHIHGIDLDPNAIILTKLNLSYKILKFVKNKLNLSDITNFINILLPILDLNLINADFLIDFKISKFIIENLSDELKELFSLYQTIIYNYNENIDKNLILKLQRMKKKIKNKVLTKSQNYILSNNLNYNILIKNKPVISCIEFFYNYFQVSNDLNYKKNKGFDIIIGNPPYFTEIRGNKEKFRLYKLSPVVKDYYEQKMDIFYFFIERSLDILKNKGYLGFIVMDYWKNRTFGNKLRKKILHSSIIHKVVEFNEYKIFSDASGQHNSILILQKYQNLFNNSNYFIKIISILNPNVSINDISKVLMSGKNIKGIECETKLLKISNLDNIQFIDKITLNILQKMEEKKNFNIPTNQIIQGLVIPQKNVKKSHLKTLNNNLNYKFNIGDGIQVISNKELKKLNLTEKELKFIKPFYEPHDIGPFYYKKKNDKWIIYVSKHYFDYDKNDINLIKNKNAILKIKNEIQLNYPNLIKHLDQFQAIITSDKKPYGLHRPRKMEIFESKNKIISVRKTPYPKFSLVPISYFMDQGVNFILLRSKIYSLYLLGLFNSKLAFFYFKNSKTHGNLLQIDKEVLLKFPIYFSKEYVNIINKIVSKIIEIKNNSVNSPSNMDLKKYTAILDIIFFKIYDLTENEVEYLLNYLKIQETEKKIYISRFISFKLDKLSV